MKIKLFILLLTMSLSVLAKTSYVVPHTATPIEIDGQALEPAWQKAKWRAINNILLGEEELDPKDFSGRFKLVWDKQYLYLLAEIVDDHLSDLYADPLEKYWAEECVEVFLDEDASGGIHTYNHNAFAYHVALDNQVVDIDVDEKPKLFNDHIYSTWQRTAQHTTWELAIKVFADDYQYGQNNQPVTLTANKKLGFMLAYCDADGQGKREHFIGSEPLKGANRDRGYIDASVFGEVVLGPVGE